MNVWIALGSLTLSIAILIGKIIYDYAKLSSRVTTLEDRFDDIDDVVKADSISIAKLTENVSYIKDRVDKLDNKIDELLRR